MRKLLLAGALLLASLTGKSQFSQSDLIYYIGTGPDTAVFVFDFQDATSDSCYAWGYLFDAAAGTVTAADMLSALVADEENLSVVTTGDFLTDVMYNAHVGLGGAPDFWGTWSKTADTDWVLNAGLVEVLSNGDWFGCSYTDFDPAIAPGEPIPAYESAKYSADDVAYWVGTGADSAVLVVDFVEPAYGEVVSYAWGYLFDGTTDGETMLNDIAAADVNLTVNAGPFLNDIFYNELEGVGGMPFYWGTWSATNLSDWTMNAGISTAVSNGDWFGCSYADWPPRRPFYPASAIDSAAFVMTDVDYWVGTGENKTIIVVDFTENEAGGSYAFGYSFETATVIASDVLDALQSEGPFGLTFDMTGGFLNDVSYLAESEEGLSGMPNYWGTWSATNVGGWALNTGIGEELSDGDWFGMTYSAFSPAYPPSLPIAGTGVAGLDEASSSSNITLFPNPANSVLNLILPENSTVQIVDVQGRVVLEQYLVFGNNTIDISDLNSGMYVVTTLINGKLVKEKLIIE